MTSTSTSALDVAPRQDVSPARLRLVQIWLFAIAFLIAAMVIVGGATRLTDSGLSITEWQPITGAIPPLSETQWLDVFKKYQAIPEYSLVNKGMSLEEFKSIFWWEWAHRFLGRFIGVAFLVPMLFFWLTGSLTRALKPRLLVAFVLGGLQGALGWYMVMSGLVDRVDVSQYRLSAHLGVAVALFSYVLWIAYDLRKWRLPAKVGPRWITHGAIGLAVLIYLQILLGAFVAGLDAGEGYNTWPLMDGALVPGGLFAMDPAWKNLFDNAMTVQFEHRCLAYVIIVLAVVYFVAVMRRVKEGPVVMSALVLVLALVAQAGLGIATLLFKVPIDLALTHQAGALVSLALALNHVHMLVRAGPDGQREAVVG